ncbi:MAG: DEAD/DEAH box helicase family protein, partial [Sedimenticola sp.]|nr:DEAD/DEAH box helicase family protein [Sedimenticola sp.]
MRSSLLTGGKHAPLLPDLLEAIYRADEIEFAVAFIKSSGLSLIFQALMDAVELRKVRLTLLTSDYLDVTDPQALRQLMLLAERGADIRVFQAGATTSFHLKAYIVIRRKGDQILEGRAFIGSSNISRSALTEGIEWNYAFGLRVGADSSQIEHFKQIRREYSDLLSHKQVMPLDYDWIDQYEQRRKVQQLPVAPGSDDPELPTPEPNMVQRSALQALSDSRRKGYRRGLVVLATGLGKTYLAAFDSKAINAKRLLFVAHREEILSQAETTFQRIHRIARVGRYTGKRKEVDADFLFASIQTLGQSHHLERFSPDHFDYVVVDEFHHAAATTYRKLLSHFNPKFMLGLTATPERTDQSDILTLCDDNLVFTSDLFRGIESKLLSPFHYYGIYDESVDYQEIPWRNGQFDPNSLSNKLATLARARHSLKEWREKAQKKTLAFCVSIKHAEFMAERYRREGVSAVAVHGDSVIGRTEALKQLADGEIEIIFSVDLFNEGVDLPAIDTVMMLRPTESKVLFLQQLGRGLRRHGGKKQLVVLDFIGNHQGFLNKPQALFGVGSTHKSLVEFGQKLKNGRLELPSGCYVNYDLKIIDFLVRLSSEGSAKAYQTLKDSLGRRPTLSEFYRSGESLQKVRQQYGQWWRLVQDQGDLSHSEVDALETIGDFLREIEITSMTKSFKAVLLEAFLEMDGLRASPTIDALSMQALKVFRRRPGFIVDIRE